MSQAACQPAKSLCAAREETVVYVDRLSCLSLPKSLLMISVCNVPPRRGVNVVLDGASVAFTPGEKIGLAGRNGAGKSSFSFDGDLDDYQQFLRNEARRMREQAAREQRSSPELTPWQFQSGSCYAARIESNGRLGSTDG